MENIFISEAIIINLSPFLSILSSLNKHYVDIGNCVENTQTTVMRPSKSISLYSSEVHFFNPSVTMGIGTHIGYEGGGGGGSGRPPRYLMTPLT